MKLRLFYALFCCLLSLGAAEWWLRGHLFDHVSYSNSESIDRQLFSQNSEGPWDLIFVGDSEVRWGVDPRAVDAAFSIEGVQIKSFNQAFDGFGASWWPALLPGLLNQPSLSDVQTVVLGVQLIDLHHVVKAGTNGCGALQRPVLTSPFAIDRGWDELCRTRTWDAELGRRLFDYLWTVRYAPSVRSLVLPAGMSQSKKLAINSRSDGAPYRGFQPHRSKEQDLDSYEDEFNRWRDQYDPARDFAPLPKGAWDKLTANDGFFDQLLTQVQTKKRRLVLFAVPTNPVVIDTFRRRDDYMANSTRLSSWAADRGVVFIDLGINDQRDANRFFSDMRHLSGFGARVFSDELGRALAKAGISKGNIP